MVEFLHFRELDETLTSILRLITDGAISSPAIGRILAASAPVPAAPSAPRPVPARTDRKLTARLTIGMATYDDFDGVYFSIQALRLYHPHIAAQAEFVVIDNNPGGRCADALKALEAAIPNYRYVPAETVSSGTAVREMVFAEAQGEIVVCMDCHVLFLPRALDALLAYFEANPGSRDLLQGPLVYDDLTTLKSHWIEEWRAGMFGRWALDERALDPGAPPFEIPMQGLGMFACLKSSWPGLNPRFQGFGGEEGYIHEKFRRHGGRVLCLPALRWLHRFPRPMGVPYPLNWGDRFRNYLLGRHELALDDVDVLEHMRTFIGAQFADDLLSKMREAGEYPADARDAIRK